MNGIPTPQQMADERAAKLDINSEAVRAGMFAAANDIAEMMKENNVDDADAALIDGAILFAVELWDNTMIAVGHAPSHSRTALHKNMLKALAKVRDKRAAAVQADAP